jgi:hypothetical protein
MFEDVKQGKKTVGAAYSEDRKGHEDDLLEVNEIIRSFIIRVIIWR